MNSTMNMIPISLDAFETMVSCAMEEKGFAVQRAAYDKVNRHIDGISVGFKGSPVQAVFDLKEPWEQMVSGKIGLGESINSVCGTLENALKYIPSAQDFLPEKLEYGKLVLCVCRREGNEAFLSRHPHKDFLDLSAFLRVRIHETATCLLSNEMASFYGLDFHTLWKELPEKLEKVRPVKIRRMEDLFPGSPAPDGMYVASYEEAGMFGAGVMLYPHFFENAYKKIGGNFFVLPSSVHEVILLKDRGDDIRYLKETVQEINESTVPIEERLSDGVYYFDGDKVTIK